MVSAPLRFFLFGALLLTMMLAHSTVFSEQRRPSASEVSLRQKVELVYSNSLRNAQRSDSVYDQVHHLRRGLGEILELRQDHPAQLPLDEKKIEKRVSQLKKMILKENPIETL